MSDDEYEYEEATPEEKLRIATHFIMKSPNGEVRDVVIDLKKLIDDPSVLTDGAVLQIMRNYNTEQLVFGESPSGEPSCVSDVGQISQDEYFQPSTNQVLTWDHMSQKFTGARDSSPQADSSTEAYRSAIESSVKKYASDVFTEGKYTVAAFAEKGGKISIVVTAKNLNLSNYWSGGWRSTYTVNVNSKGQATISGLIRLNVHYFEDGNVQLNNDFTSTSNVTIGDVAETGTAIATAIDKIESEFQKNLEEFYVNMHNVTFKTMRRFLPVTRKPMNWNQAAHALASEVSKS